MEKIISSFPTKIIDASKYSSWDIYFLSLALNTSYKSKDPSTQVGAVIAKDNTVISTGYNGFPRQMKDCSKLLNNRESKLERTIHGEINAFIFAKRDISGATLYTWPFIPCDKCAPIFIQAGIKRVVYPEYGSGVPDRWKYSMDLSKEFFIESGVEVCGVLFEGEIK